MLPRRLANSPINRSPVVQQVNYSLKAAPSCACLRSTGPVVINAPYHADFCDLSDHGSAFAAVDIGKICKEVDLALSKQ
jgi:hypothetical protein